MIHGQALLQYSHSTIMQTIALHFIFSSLFLFADFVECFAIDRRSKIAMMPEPALIVQLEQKYLQFTIPVKTAAGNTYRFIVDTGSTDLIVSVNHYAEFQAFNEGVDQNYVRDFVVDEQHYEFSACKWASQDFMFVKEAITFQNNTLLQRSMPKASNTWGLICLQVSAMHLAGTIDGLNLVTPPPLHYWQVSDGMMGVNYMAGFRTNGTVFAGLLQGSAFDNGSDVFSLNLNYNNRNQNISTSTTGINSTIEFGGVSALYKESMQWSEGSYFLPDDGTDIGFQLFHLSVCGVDLFGNYSSNWPAIVDTGSVCLELPQEFFDSLMGWIPSDCSRTFNPNLYGTDGYYIECYLPSGIDLSVTELPWLSFRMSEFGDELSIRLNDLVLDPVDAGGRRKYCILRGSSINYNTDYMPHISLGSMVIANFYASFSMAEALIGLANDKSRDAKSLIALGQQQCLPVKSCIGYSTYTAASNICLPPNCRVYASVYTLDLTTMTCVLNPSQLILLAILISFLMSMEIVLYASKTYMANGLLQSSSASARRRSHRTADRDLTL